MVTKHDITLNKNSGTSKTRPFDDVVDFISHSVLLRTVYSSRITRHYNIGSHPQRVLEPTPYVTTCSLGIAETVFSDEQVLIVHTALVVVHIYYFCAAS